MTETFDLRLFEDEANQFLPSHVGVRKTVARQVIVRSGDPLFMTIGERSRMLRRQGRLLVGGWRVRRRYSPEELRAASLFRVGAMRIVEPPGEACGTRYDDTEACAVCGAGAGLRGDLRLDASRVPRNVDVFATIAGEMVVSASFHGVCADAGATGARFARVQFVGKGSVPYEYYQLLPSARRVEFAEGTRFGADPFDEECAGRCVMGDTAGLNLLSQAFVRRDSVGPSHFVWSRQHVGVRSGLLRPQPVLFVSSGMRHRLRRAGLAGIHEEIATVV